MVLTVLSFSLISQNTGQHWAKPIPNTSVSHRYQPPPGYFPHLLQHKCTSQGPAAPGPAPWRWHLCTSRCAGLQTVLQNIPFPALRGWLEINQLPKLEREKLGFKPKRAAQEVLGQTWLPQRLASHAARLHFPAAKWIETFTFRLVTPVPSSQLLQAHLQPNSSSATPASQQKRVFPLPPNRKAPLDLEAINHQVPSQELNTWH